MMWMDDGRWTIDDAAPFREKTVELNATNAKVYEILACAAVCPCVD
jgi:hypothetical protein